MNISGDGLRDGYKLEGISCIFRFVVFPPAPAGPALRWCVCREKTLMRLRGIAKYL